MTKLALNETKRMTVFCVVKATMSVKKKGIETDINLLSCYSVILGQATFLNMNLRQTAVWNGEES